MVWLAHRGAIRQGWICPQTFSFLGVSGLDGLTLANSRLCSGVTRPGIETRYLE